MMTNRYFQKAVFLLALVPLLGGCDDGGNEKGAASPSATAVVVTLDANRQEIYETSCKICHGLANSGAPQTGVAADWQERSARGMEVMVDNAMNGYQAMPPMGGCFHCTEEDFRQLIGFMTSGIAN
jgi:cytochrome c5